MGVATATIEMRAPEEHRERLHEIVKVASTVMVLARWAGGPGRRDAIDGRPMTLVRTGDDTTMYVATSLDAGQVDELERDPQVTVVVPGAEYALFTAEAQICRDRELLDDVWSDAWNRWFRGKSDPSIAIIMLSPIEGSYWEAKDRHSYVYQLRLLPPSRGDDSDGIPIENAPGLRGYTGSR
jgi:general stress protein 26